MNFRKLKMSDKKNASALFEACLADLIRREGIDEPGLLENEIERLNMVAAASLQYAGPCMYIIESEGTLLGTAALVPPGSIAVSHANAVESDIEIGCVYVHPSHQRKGVGQFLFRSVFEKAKESPGARFFLDAGFSSSRVYWTKQLGQPNIILEDYWGIGQPHAIWVKDLE
ncbi:GNAT family N-acetyltransferase [Planococcus sp. FY231025]|uniref:GNAT family N-acetyltransferase n=1 Tax=Planococcus sp. FY231025 TaxID=3455699 RepID=UPI003F9253AE